MMLAKTPPMGWNTWNTFGHDISEELILQTADQFVGLGLREAGYEYVVIDDCWAGVIRDENGKLCADPQKFPHGMRYLADYIHARGLKFGIYSNAGYKTCAGHAASFDHEFEDARTFAEWGVDYLKYDCCYIPPKADHENLYHRMGIALRECGRDIVFAACDSYPGVHNFMRSAGAHLYRTTTDIQDNPIAVRDIAYSQIPLLGSSGIGCYNDIDMLVVGMFNNGNAAVRFGGCTAEEYKMHFALWCMMAAPLMIGCDVRKASSDMIELLKNKDLIRIDQDEECRPPYVISERLDNKLVLFRLLSDGEYAVGLFNYTEEDRRPLNIDLFTAGVPRTSGMALDLKDVFTGEEIHNVSETIGISVPPRTCRVFLARMHRI